MNSKSPQHLLSEVRIFCIYAEENKVSFSAAGFFPISWNQLGIVKWENASSLSFDKIPFFLVLVRKCIVFAIFDSISDKHFAK